MTTIRRRVIRVLEVAEARRFEEIGLRYAKLRLFVIRSLLRRLDPAGPWKEPFPSWR